MKLDIKGVKDAIKLRYSAAVSGSQSDSAGNCCGDNSKEGKSSAGCCGIEGCYSAGVPGMSSDYKDVPGHFEDADYGLGCGIPVMVAHLKPGEVVLDLGSGAGNDSFVARSFVGESGRVTGVDFTPEMVLKARENAKKLGYSNVDFIEGDIESIPLGDNYADIVLSNCVLNLVPDKEQAFREIFRVLKPGGRFCISDVVSEEELPEEIRTSPGFIAGCVGGALTRAQYLSCIGKAGFAQVKVHSEKPLKTDESLAIMIFSITVTGIKPV